MQYQDVVKEFAERTRANLRAIECLKVGGFEVYETTQLVNSMLGLLVFPREEFVDQVPDTPLAHLVAAGWPRPKTSPNFPEVTDLRQLIRYLRNAIAHFNVEFLSDVQQQVVGLRVWNTPPNRDVKNWEAELRVTELRQIAENFTDLILAKTVDAPSRRPHTAV